MARSTARKRALNTLYEADEKSQDISNVTSTVGSAALG